MSNPLEYAKSHPYIVGGAVFAIGALFLVMRGSGGGAQQASDAGLAGAYYGAIAADKTSAAQEVIATTNANAAVDLGQIQADAYTHVQDTWADVSNNATESNNAAAIATAPYQLASQYIGALASVASKPGVTTTSNDSGFFGIGASSSSSYTPDPAAVAASNQLTSGWFNGFLPGH